ncbi:unnamed protein product [Zymoseptoria tritici ST99CH_1A5]|uniref:Uncharacterized protein n=1 Tax=Zymoseptoria tritici ST99CH_1A5 TaxID=1276529 RepID=A0A1Y6M2G3_ZYMTR|nr:unnamed protein product [Zymoseptoria tritici ST99CH_1A5]
MAYSTDWLTWEQSRAAGPVTPKTAHPRLEVMRQRVTEAINACIDGSRSPEASACMIGDTYQGHWTLPFNECKFVWSEIASASLRVDETFAPRLADLFIAIKAQPDLVNAAGYPTDIGGRFWKDTPSWGWMFYEHALDINPLEVHPEVDPRDADRTWREQGSGLISCTMFCANLLVRADFETHMERYAHEAMEAGLELGYALNEADRKIERYWEIYLPPAAAWVLIAGERLYELCFGLVGGGRPEAKYWSKDRWAGWKEKFAVMARGAGIDEDARCMEFARRAEGRMEKIEEAEGSTIHQSWIDGLEHELAPVDARPNEYKAAPSGD